MDALRPGGFLLSQVHHLSGRTFARLLKTHGMDEINPAQGRILFVLWQSDEIPITELARRTSLGKSTLTAMLDRLVADGYVERVPSPTDRRTVLIRRTRKDEGFRQAFLAVSAEMTELWYAGLSEAERDQFELLLGRILANLKALEDGQ
ncbi:MAG TPA: MarR family transcriptional regulator [Magnetospirillum sp.]|jgi:DNA-binding MarR family transcriptional regulator|nr:MarR family transcriptional regulator [Magnetospirillum sp.]